MNNLGGGGGVKIRFTKTYIYSILFHRQGYQDIYNCVNEAQAKNHLYSIDDNCFNVYNRLFQFTFSTVTLTVVSPASGCARNFGSSNSLNAGILSDGGTSGNKSTGKYGNTVALADARITRRIGSGVIVASIVGCVRFNEPELYCARFSSRMCIYICMALLIY